MNPEMQLATTQLDLLPSSLTSFDGMEFGFTRHIKGRRLAVLAEPARMAGFDGERSEFSGRSDHKLFHNGPRGKVDGEQGASR